MQKNSIFNIPYSIKSYIVAGGMSIMPNIIELDQFELGYCSTATYISVNDMLPIQEYNLPLSEIHEGLQNSFSASLNLNDDSQAQDQNTFLSKLNNNNTFHTSLKSQLVLASLGNKMFQGTKPMDGAELSSLYKAMKKQRNSSSNSLL